MNSGAKAILSVLGVTLPAVFSYLSARAESNEAKIRAEVAYVTLQGSVVELQRRAEEQDAQVAKLQGQLELLGRWRTERSERTPLAVPLHPKMLAPPERFTDAVDQFKAKK